jgi:hypothetical protein
MAIEWNQAFGYQPMGGFSAPMQIPSYSGAKLKSSDQRGLPSFKGIDFQTGKRVDLADFFKNPVYSAPSAQPPALPTDSAIPGVDPKIQSWLELYKATSPQRLAEMEAAANISANLSERQLRQLYPYLSAAGAEATARSLAASKSYRAFTEQMPTNVQNIMASKQAQATSAASAEAERQRATAAQQEAASRYGGRFAGQFIQVG